MVLPTAGVTPSRIVSRLSEPEPRGAVILAMIVPCKARFGADETTNGWSDDVPPPGIGLKTVICAVLDAAMSLAGMAAVSCVALTTVVVRSTPFQRTLEPPMKLEPLTLRVKPAPPVVAFAGDNEAWTGTGLLAAGPLTVNV